MKNKKWSWPGNAVEIVFNSVIHMVTPNMHDPSTLVFKDNLLGMIIKMIEISAMYSKPILNIKTQIKAEFLSEPW